MDKATLLTQLDGPLSKNWVNRLSAQLTTDSFALTALLELTLHEKDQVAFRAAWLLDTLVISDLGRFTNDIDNLLRYSLLARHHSCYRHYARIFRELTSAKAPQNVKDKLTKMDLDLLVEQCFERMMGPKVKVAVKAFCAEILFNIRDRYDWVAEALQDQLIQADA
jgi:hypothetical protein